VLPSRQRARVHDDEIWFSREQNYFVREFGDYLGEDARTRIMECGFEAFLMRLDAGPRLDEVDPDVSRRNAKAGVQHKIAIHAENLGDLKLSNGISLGDSIKELMT
jgi:hypothetical protein